MKTILCTLLCLSAAFAADVTVEGVTFNDNEQQAVLEVVNKASFETLHYTFDIYEYKTNNIIAGRWYPDLAKLAAVDGVTTFVLNLLKNEVNDQCAAQGSQGGRYDGVTFTDGEADNVLKAVNRASFKSLVDVADVYSYKVVNIFKARQICTMQQLSQISGVTNFVMRLLKSYVSAANICFEHAECAADFRCYGIPHDGILPTGKCSPLSVAGEGASCDAATPCPAGTVCSGLTMGWPQGICRAAWMAATFVPPSHVSDVNVETQTTTFFAVSGLATVPEDVVLKIDATNIVNPSGLKIVLSDPNGAKATYWDGATMTGSIPASLPMGGEISRDDTINGKWTVTVTNYGAATGHLKSFSLYLTSRWD